MDFVADSAAAMTPSSSRTRLRRLREPVQPARRTADAGCAEDEDEADRATGDDAVAASSTHGSSRSTSAVAAAPGEPDTKSPAAAASSKAKSTGVIGRAFAAAAEKMRGGKRPPS